MIEAYPPAKDKNYIFDSYDHFKVAEGVQKLNQVRKNWDIWLSYRSPYYWINIFEQNIAFSLRRIYKGMLQNKLL